MSSLNIEFVSFDTEEKTNSKGSKYTQGLVTYRAFGKLNEKSLMSFGAQADVFHYFNNGKVSKGDNITIQVIKNDKGYNDWVSIGEGGGEVKQAAKSGGNPTPRSTYETPEERALRQVLIVRQSSVSSAIEFFKLNTKKVPAVQEVVEVAKFFEQYVFGKNSTPQSDGGLAEMSDDVV